MNYHTVVLFLPVTLLLGSNCTAQAVGAPKSFNVAANPTATDSKVTSSDAEIIAGKKPLPGLRLQLSTPRTQYEQGEPIEVTMRYTYTGERKLSVLGVSYDRSGRIGDFGFSGIDEAGKRVRDPIQYWLGGIGGGVRGGQELLPQQPYEQKAIINEWLVFDKPGRYLIKAHSYIVHLGASPHRSSGIPLTSEALPLTITLPNDAHRRQRIAQAYATLQRAASSRAQYEKDPFKGKTKWKTREQAMRDLRFMVDKRAIPLLVRGLSDPVGNVVLSAEFGLLAFRDMRPVKEALLRSINDPAHFIMPSQAWPYIDLLTAYDLCAKGASPGRWSRAYESVSQPWREVFTRKVNARLLKLPPAQAVGVVLEAISYQLLPAPQTRHWRLIIDHAAAITGFNQSRAAYLLKEMCRDKAVTRNLKRMIADHRVAPDIRAAGKTALHAMAKKPL